MQPYTWAVYLRPRLKMPPLGVLPRVTRPPFFGYHVDAYRVQFPLSYGINNFGVLASMACGLLSVMFYRSREIPRMLTGALACASLYCLTIVARP